MTIGNVIIPIDFPFFFRGVALAHQPANSLWAPNMKSSSHRRSLSHLARQRHPGGVNLTDLTAVSRRRHFFFYGGLTIRTGRFIGLYWLNHGWITKKIHGCSWEFHWHHMDFPNSQRRNDGFDHRGLGLLRSTCLPGKNPPNLCRMGPRCERWFINHEISPMIILVRYIYHF